MRTIAFHKQTVIGCKVAETKGFTLIEMLISISIIALLMSLVLPAVSSARTSARRVQCKNNLRNLALGMVALAESRQRFPASGNMRRNAQNTGIDQFHSWVVELLPWIDRNDIAEQWNKDLPITDAQNRRFADLYIGVLACPDDFSVAKKGDLSYVVNGGWGWTSEIGGVGDCPIGAEGLALDLNGNGITCPNNISSDGQPNDRELFKMTGLFFLETWQVPGTTRHHRIDDIQDGISQTILISENVRAGYDPALPDTNWSSPDPLRTCFYLSPRICVNSSCSPGNVDYQRANSGFGAINSGLNLAEGQSPWPSSLHVGGVHMAFADGHIQFISEQINGGVYAALVSPQGSRLQNALQQPLVSDNQY